MVLEAFLVVFVAEYLRNQTEQFDYKVKNPEKIRSEHVFCS